MALIGVFSPPPRPPLPGHSHSESDFDSSVSPRSVSMITPIPQMASTLHPDEILAGAPPTWPQHTANGNTVHTPLTSIARMIPSNVNLDPKASTGRPVGGESSSTVLSSSNTLVGGVDGEADPSHPNRTSAPGVSPHATADVRLTPKSHPTSVSSASTAADAPRGGKQQAAPTTTATHHLNDEQQQQQESPKANLDGGTGLIPLRHALWFVLLLEARERVPKVSIWQNMPKAIPLLQRRFSRRYVSESIQYSRLGDQSPILKKSNFIANRLRSWVRKATNTAWDRCLDTAFDALLSEQRSTSSSVTKAMSGLQREGANFVIPPKRVPLVQPSRLALRFNADLRSTLFALYWTPMTDTDKRHDKHHPPPPHVPVPPTGVTRAKFRTFHRQVHFVFFGADPSPHEIDREFNYFSCAASLYSAPSSSDSLLTFDQFATYLFGIADFSCVSAAATEYTLFFQTAAPFFLSKLGTLHAVTAVHSASVFGKPTKRRVSSGGTVQPRPPSGTGNQTTSSRRQRMRSPPRPAWNAGLLRSSAGSIGGNIAASGSPLGQHVATSAVASPLTPRTPQSPTGGGWSASPQQEDAEKSPRVIVQFSDPIHVPKVRCRWGKEVTIVQPTTEAIAAEEVPLLQRMLLQRGEEHETSDVDGRRRSSNEFRAFDFRQQSPVPTTRENSLPGELGDASNLSFGAMDEGEADNSMLLSSFSIGRKATHPGGTGTAGILHASSNRVQLTTEAEELIARTNHFAGEPLRSPSARDSSSMNRGVHQGRTTVGKKSVAFGSTSISFGVAPGSSDDDELDTAAMTGRGLALERKTSLMLQRWSRASLFSAVATAGERSTSTRSASLFTASGRKVSQANGSLSPTAGRGPSNTAGAAGDVGSQSEGQPVTCATIECCLTQLPSEVDAAPVAPSQPTTNRFWSSSQRSGASRHKRSADPKNSAQTSTTTTRR